MENKINVLSEGNLKKGKIAVIDENIVYCLSETYEKPSKSIRNRIY